MTQPRHPAAPAAASTHDSPRARATTAFVLETAQALRRPGREIRDRSTIETLRALTAAGSTPWLDAADPDGLSVWSPDLRGVTTGSALLNREVQKGTHDELIRRAAEMLRRADRGLGDDQVVMETALVLSAVQGLSLVDALGVDVGVELHTDLADDVERSHECGRLLHAICPEHFVVKVPLTPAGLLAARRLRSDGVRVDCTLGFSPRQNRLAVEFVQPHFVDSFVGRVDELLAQSDLPRTEGAGIAAAIGSQRLVREWNASPGASHPVRQVAASLRNRDQVLGLAGIDVLAMPAAVVRELAAHAIAPAAIVDRTAEAAEMPAAPQLREASVHVFWEVGDLPGVAARQLEQRSPESLDGERLRAVLQDFGLGDLFPQLSAEDRARLANDGRIPDWRFWRERVTSGAASWDGLLTAAGLARLAAVQTELDLLILKNL